MMSDTLTAGVHPADTIVAAARELDPTWRSDLLSGFGDNWGDAEPSWLTPEDDN